MRGNVKAARERYATQAEIDRVALALIESVGPAAAYSQAFNQTAPPVRPAINYRDREITHTSRSGQMHLKL